MTSLENEILAVFLDEAVEVLKKSGLKYVIEYTGFAGSGTAAAGRERVVRFNLRGETGFITIACEQSKKEV
ncbi:MAG: hypothetical protein VR68_12365 [Peptococcaceae bacterium BRH_c4a]|nr:MAG: hypothetical protein VR68_12365 [Peptococcaceae bacterium BRH_c4a]